MKKHHGVPTYGSAKRTTTARIGELGAQSKPAADGWKNLAGEPGGAGRLQNSPKPAATPG